jgi:hypothetical protein
MSPARFTSLTVYCHDGAPGSHVPTPFPWDWVPLITGTFAAGLQVASARERASGTAKATPTAIASAAQAAISVGIDR